MLISGYYGIKVNYRKFLELLLITVFYYVILSFAAKGYVEIRGLFFSFDMWWYIGAYLFICLISPLLNVALKIIDKRTFQILIFTLLGYEYVGCFLEIRNSHDVSFLLSVYLIGRYMKLTPPNC